MGTLDVGRFVGSLMWRKAAERAEWLEDPTLDRLVLTVAATYRLQPQDIAEVLQETRIAIWQADSPGRVSRAWVLRVAKNKAVDLVRSRSRVRARDREFTHVPSHGTRDADLEILLKARVAKLPTRLREFYDQHYTQGWSEREIAIQHGVCRASVRWLDHQCRRLVGAIATCARRGGM